MARKMNFGDGGATLRESRDSICDIWGPRTGSHGADAWPVRGDEALTEEPDHWVQSACVLCSNGCALDIGVREGRIMGVRGARPTGSTAAGWVQGPARLARDEKPRPANDAAHPRGHRVPGGKLGRGGGPDRAEVARSRGALQRLLGWISTS